MKKRQSRRPVSGTDSDAMSKALQEAAAPAAILMGFRDYLAAKKGMPGIARDLKISQAQFRKQLRQEFTNGSITIKMPRNADLETKLSASWPKVTHYVLNAEDAMFFEGAAGVFFDEMRDVLTDRDPAKPFRIGVVSGRTTGGMIEAIVNIPKWRTLVPVGKFPHSIATFALNVSQTEGFDELRGNANVLAYELARKISEQVKASTVEAYGLSGALLQTKQEVRRTDCSSETSAVLRFTDPARLAESQSAEDRKIDEDLPKQSQLDVVITGVGSITDSLFGRYSEANGIDTTKLIDQGIVGDIAYCPVTRIGESLKLRNKDGDEVEFYRAVSLEVLKKMSESLAKKVVVVARNARDSSKIHPIHAAISARLCNVLITDGETARKLHRALGDLGT